jgi:hypothetical protein
MTSRLSRHSLSLEHVYRHHIGSGDVNVAGVSSWSAHPERVVSSIYHHIGMKEITSTSMERTHSFPLTYVSVVDGHFATSILNLPDEH